MGIEIYAGERQCGKTAWIIQKSANTGIPIATCNKKKAEEILKRAKEMGYSIPEPVCLRFTTSVKLPKDILLDDLEDEIPHFLPDVHIYAATVTAVNMKRKGKEEMDTSYKVDTSCKGPMFDRYGKPVEPVPGTFMNADNIDPDGPSGDNWKERLSLEYQDTKSRYEKLNKYVKKKYAEWISVGFFGNSSEKFSFDIQQKQLRVMKKYLDILEMRMALANIPF